MDNVCGLDLETARSSSFLADCNKNVAVRGSRRGETTTSRYRSPVPIPNARRLASDLIKPMPKKDVSTPFKDTAAGYLLEGRKVVRSKVPESLGPSKMRSLTVAFQSDILSVPVSKVQRQASHADCALRSSANVAQRKRDTKQSRVRGRKNIHKSENSEPVDGVHARLQNEDQWLNKKSGSVSFDKASESSSLYRLGSNMLSVRRLSLDNGNVLSDECWVQMKKCVSSSSADRIQLAKSALRALSIPVHVSSPLSPRVSRGISPRRTLSSSPSRQAQTSTSVLCFFVDIKKGDKVVSHIEDVHHLRLLYNRHLQWRYANAHSDGVLRSQQRKAEKMLYSLWSTIMNMWDSVIEKRISFQQLNLKLMLHSVLNSQVTCLNRWASIEKNHTNSLTWAIQDLRTSTVLIPLTGGARGDIKTIKSAMRSALDVFQKMGATSYPIVSQVEGTSSLVSQLANVAARERAVIDEFESLLSSAAALQVEEQSLRAHLLQMNKLMVKNH